MKTHFTVRIDEKLKQDMENEAKEKGVRITQIAEKRLNAGISFIPKVQDFLDDWSKELNVPVAQVLENIVIAYIARSAAEAKHQPRVLIEFSHWSGGVFYSGEKLFKKIYREYCKRFENEKEK